MHVSFIVSDIHFNQQWMVFYSAFLKFENICSQNLATAPIFIVFFEMEWSWEEASVGHMVAYGNEEESPVAFSFCILQEFSQTF